MPAINWTDEKVAQLTQRWAAGETCAEIGQAMSATRNAIIGKVHRLGLAQRCNKVSAAELERRAQVRQRRVEARVARGMFPGRARPKMQEPVIKIAVAQFSGSLEIPFAELNAFKAGDANNAASSPQKFQVPIISHAEMKRCRARVGVGTAGVSCSAATTICRTIFVSCLREMRRDVSVAPK